MSQHDEHPWWQTAVVYQIYPRSFKDTTGSGIGDLPGILDKLDYLSGTLGVDAVWLSPFYPSPMADFGYDVSDYCDVHPMFGTLGDFDRLLARAHVLGLTVIVDFVPSHSSDQHPWFVESRASRENPRRDWYVWRDPKPDGSPPNNWLSVFGGSAWELDERTGQYYRHSFLREQPDLNWRHPPLRAAMLDVMRFWLERGVDGFRVDAVQFLLKDPAERDNPPNTGGGARAHKPLGAYESQVHLYDVAHPDIHQIFREMRAVADRYDPPRMTLGELHVYDPVELGAYYGAGLDGLTMPTNFGLFKAPWTAAGVRGVVDGLEGGLPARAWPNYSLGNHDDQRLATRLGEAGSRQAAVLLLTLRGTPILYYGDELGMREVEVPPDRRQDPLGIADPALSRDGCRAPMPWSAGAGAGFTSAPEPWLPLGDDWTVRNVDTQLRDPDSLLNLYRRLLSLRRTTPALRAGAYRPLDPVPKDCFVYERTLESVRVVVAVNVSAERRSVGLPGFAGLVAVSTHRATEGGAADEAVTLLPQEAVVLVARHPPPAGLRA
jgi:glycosidase